MLLGRAAPRPRSEWERYSILPAASYTAALGMTVAFESESFGWK
jgi:hypothetical protein